MSLGGWDIVASYFKGYEHTAVFEGVVGRVDLEAGTADIIVNYIYPEQEVLGLDVAGYFGRLGVHAEGAHFAVEETGHDVGVGDQDYTSVIGGIDYPFYDVIGLQDMTVYIEYAREMKEDEDDRIYVNRIYKDSILCRLQHDVDFRSSGEIRYIYNFDTDGHYAAISYSYQYSDYAEFKIGVDLLGGPAGCFFGEYDENDRVFATFEVAF
jgi:hypothetical protein